MDAKVTMSLDKDVNQKAKEFAAAQNISLSRFLEYLLRKATSGNYQQLEDMPIVDWVSEVAEGKAEYLTKPKARKALKKEFFESRK